MKPLKIGISWVRGVVGETLAPELLVDFACAFGTFVEGGPVAVGHDSRRSAPMLHAAVLAGLQSCGCRILDLGLLPTPIVQHTVRSRKLAGGISITASHNDADWNALKFIGKNGALLNPFQSEEVMDIYHLGEFRKCAWDKLGTIRAVSDPAGPYFRALARKLDTTSIRKRKPKVVVDACGGAGAGLASAFLAGIGCSVTALSDEPDGEFPHSPEPNIANMRGLASVVRSVGADVGFLLNSDVDRVGLVCAGGEALSEEYVFPIVADYILESTPGGVVSTLSTSRMVESVAARHHRPFSRSRIGEGYVVPKVLLSRAAVGGEGSGGVVASRWGSWFDGFLTMGLILERLSRERQTLSGMAARMPSYYMIKSSVASSSERMYLVIGEFRRQYRAMSPHLEDGVRVDWKDSWMSVRASNTEPLIRIIVESEDPERARSIYEDCMERINRLQA